MDKEKNVFKKVDSRSMLVGKKERENEEFIFVREGLGMAGILTMYKKEMFVEFS